MTDSEPKYETVSVPMLDTGIGRAAGFESDKALHDAVEAEIAALPEPVQRVIREANRRIDREIMFGPDK